MHSGRPSIGREFHARVDSFLEEHPELGYSNTGELIRELLRGWMVEQERRNANAPSPPMP